MVLGRVVATRVEAIASRGEAVASKKHVNVFPISVDVGDWHRHSRNQPIEHGVNMRKPSKFKEKQLPLCCHLNLLQ